MTRSTADAVCVTLIVLLLPPVLIQSPGTACAAEAQPVNPQALALQHFQERVKAYVQLRDRVEANLPPQKSTEDPARIKQREKALALGIAEARRDAQPGDVFTPEVGPVIRRLVAADFTRRTLKQRRAALQEVPALHLEVNQQYPMSQPLATVPPRLLASLPRLPDGLEYRFVGNSLILRDVNANLVVDVLDAAIPRR